MYYLTGYDTDGFVWFQTLFVNKDGAMTLVTRSADRQQAAYTSLIKDVRIWVDGQEGHPASEVRAMLLSHDILPSDIIGVEYDAFGLSAKRGKMLETGLENICVLKDASDLVRLQRLTKTSAELEFVREAGRICQQMQAEAVRLSVAGKFEGDIRAAMHEICWARDGDAPAHVNIIGSGASAQLVRYKAGGRKISAKDQVFHEFAASYRHYNAALTFALVTGEASPQHEKMFEVCKAALSDCKAALVKGNTVGQVFEAHKRAFVDGGWGVIFSQH